MKIMKQKRVSAQYVHAKLMQFVEMNEKKKKVYSSIPHYILINLQNISSALQPAK
jgi:hypothetical protein